MEKAGNHLKLNHEYGIVHTNYVFAVTYTLDLCPAG